MIIVLLEKLRIVYLNFHIIIYNIGFCLSILGLAYTSVPKGVIVLLLATKESAPEARE